MVWSDLIDHLPSNSTLAEVHAFGIECGWYIVREDDNGLLWAMTYGDQTFGEESARADFAEACLVYEAWNTDDDDQITEEY